MEEQYYSAKQPDYIFVSPPPVTWHFCFGDWSVQFNLTGKAPNRFHRFMLRLLLGIHSKLAERKE